MHGTNKKYVSNCGFEHTTQTNCFSGDGVSFLL